MKNHSQNDCNEFWERVACVENARVRLSGGFSHGITEGTLEVYMAYRINYKIQKAAPSFNKGSTRPPLSSK